MKIGIIGGNGMLGTDLVLLLKSKRFESNIFCYPEYDITKNEDLIRIVDSSDVIVNCAAYTAVDKAESDVDECYAINADAVAKLGKYIAEAGKYIVHVSTDFVFGDCSSGTLSELSQTKPLGVYGETKLEGEVLLQKSGAEHSILRIEWTYGSHGNNFISKIVSLATKYNEIKVVDDQYGSPTSTIEVSRAIISLINSRSTGLYHFASKGYVSRYEVACKIFDVLNIKANVLSCGSDEFPAPAKRPQNSRFNCSKIDKILDFERPCWEDSLATYLLKLPIH